MDPQSVMRQKFHSDETELGAANNHAFYFDPLVDYHIEQAANTLDIEERKENLVKAQRRAMSSYVHLPAYHLIETRGVNADVKDFKISPLSRMNLVTPFNNVSVE